MLGMRREGGIACCMSVLGWEKGRQECAMRGSSFVSYDVQMIDRGSGGHPLSA